MWAKECDRQIKLVIHCMVLFIIEMPVTPQNIRYGVSYLDVSDHPSFQSLAYKSAAQSSKVTLLLTLVFSQAFLTVWCVQGR